MLDNMRSPNPRPNLMYEWKGYKPHPNGWAYSRDTMERLDSEGTIWYPGDFSKKPRLKRYWIKRGEFSRRTFGPISPQSILKLKSEWAIPRKNLKLC